MYFYEHGIEKPSFGAGKIFHIDLPNDAEIIAIFSEEGVRLAFTTNHEANTFFYWSDDVSDTRSFVWYQPNTEMKPDTYPLDNWKLQYRGSVTLAEERYFLFEITFPGT